MKERKAKANCFTYLLKLIWWRGRVVKDKLKVCWFKSIREPEKYIHRTHEIA